MNLAIPEREAVDVRDRPAAPSLSHIRHWIFDLDNVLYPSACNLFALIDEKMGAFIAERLGCDAKEARIVQKRYFHDHGTTLAGLMHHNGIDPREFLDYVHDIDMSALEPAPALRDGIAALPGEKLVFTNGDRDYALRVLAARGLGGLFDPVHDILAGDLVPKPDTAAYERLVAATGIDPTRALFVEDMARNLLPAKRLGMTTIWVDTGASWAGPDGDSDHVDITIPDLESWIADLTRDRAAG